MRILVVSAMFPPIQTGTSFYSCTLTETLQKLGHEVTFVSVSNIEAEPDNYLFPVNRIKALHYKGISFFKHFRISSIYPSNYKKLSQLAKDTKAEAVLLINHYLDIAFPAIYAAKKNKLPIVVSIGTPIQSSNPIKDRILRIFDRLICGTLIHPFCDRVIPWDVEIQRYIFEVQSKKTASKCVIVPYGVEGCEDKYLKTQHDYSKVEQILGVGAVIDQRNYLFNIRVFKELLKIYPHLKMKIIGHVYIQDAVKLVKKLRIEDKVIFTGELPHDEVVKEMQKSVLHWMMLSGRYTGIGTSTMEAMLSGIPVISNFPSNLFGRNDFIDLNNYIYTDGINVQLTVMKLKNVLDDEELRKTIGQNGAQYILKYLNWNTIGKQMAQVLEDMIKVKK